MPAKPAARKKQDPEALRLRRIVRKLKKMHPEMRSGLDFNNPFELLVSTILSAQCTDARVNKVTPALFAALPDPAAFAAASLGKIEKLIHTTGFYRAKARNIQACARQLLERHEGKVPESMEELTALAGVGRKTAHCVRAWAFGKPGLTVDTHFKRIVARLGITEETDPVKIEHVMAEKLPPRDWSPFSHAIIMHGRSICPARRPRCEACPLLPDCPHGQGL